MNALLAKFAPCACGQLSNPSEMHKAMNKPETGTAARVRPPPTSRQVVVVAAMPPRQKPTMGGNHRYLLNLLDVLISSQVVTTVICDEADHYDELLQQIHEFLLLSFRHCFAKSAYGHITECDKTIKVNTMIRL